MAEPYPSWGKDIPPSLAPSLPSLLIPSKWGEGHRQQDPVFPGNGLKKLRSVTGVGAGRTKSWTTGLKLMRPQPQDTGPTDTEIESDDYKMICFPTYFGGFHAPPCLPF